jgi:hypothetical protein
MTYKMADSIRRRKNAKQYPPEFKDEEPQPKPKKDTLPPKRVGKVEPRGQA